MEEIKIDIEAENKEIVRRYRKLVTLARPTFKDGDAQMVRKAFKFALDAHSSQRRKSGEPYIYHPIAVAQIAVEEIGLGPTSIIASLLHDVVEDTEWELKDIEREFGAKVAQIIDGLTKISGAFTPGSSQQAENFRKMLLTLTDDVRVILIKLADRLHNMRTLESMQRNTQLKIASETIYLYAPLAHRLGLYAIKTELEDLYLKYTEPVVYKEISDKIKQTKAARTKFIKDFIAPIDNELNKQNFKVTIKGRPKSIHSIWNKMRKQGIPFEQVYDLFAIRIIIDTAYEHEKADCWKVYSIVTDYYTPSPERLRDWVSTPKSNGYESLHTTVMSKAGQWVEVQIRTQRMDDIAEKGYAAHWKYKDAQAGNNSPATRESGIEQWIGKVREMIEQNDSNAIDFVNDFRSNLFNDEVFVFTPKGDLKVLPAGSCVLDLAFDIHSQVGARCIGAKINQRLVPINSKLNNGDQVEILTSTKQRPSADWLKFVVSSKAISKIKEVLREHTRAQISEGRDIVERKLKQFKITLSDEIQNQLKSFFSQKTPQDLFLKIAQGVIDPKELKRFKEARDEGFPRPTPTGAASNATALLLDGKSIERELKRTQGTDYLVIGRGDSKIEYALATCCNPIAGDTIFGYVTSNGSIKIHRTSCPNAPEMMAQHGYRILKAQWASQQDSSYSVGLKVMGTDRIGLVSSVTKVISQQLKVNMESIALKTKDGVFDGEIVLSVHDTDHLNELIHLLSKVEGVVNVSRFDV